MRGVGPAYIATADGRLLAATRTDDIADQDQLLKVVDSLRCAAPSNVVSFGGFQ